MENENRLIVNADDYGRTPGVSEGIRKAYCEGIVTSTTALMNMPGIEGDLRTALAATPDLGLGVHLVLTSGAPVLPPQSLPSIMAGRESFPGQEYFLRNLDRIGPEQAADEWDAQIRKFIAITGRNPDHLDSHHHTSYFSEPLFDKFLELARRYDCAIRIPTPCPSGSCDGLPGELCPAAREFIPRLTAKFRTDKPDYFVGTFYNQQATHEQLTSIIRRLAHGVTELMCHPGYADQELIEGSSYNTPREREIQILTMEFIRQELSNQGIRLINFSELR
jgi:predicted glycoside hydrolase/deacetylase ChbG (UPF0249 family)